tara:strand:- start:46795 stop:47130 length:336 start_codon:yes stop_codon:yes gene_type:complete
MLHTVIAHALIAPRESILAQSAQPVSAHASAVRVESILGQSVQVVTAHALIVQVESFPGPAEPASVLAHLVPLERLHIVAVANVDVLLANNQTYSILICVKRAQTKHTKTQ